MINVEELDSSIFYRINKKDRFKMVLIDDLNENIINIHKETNIINVHKDIDKGAGNSKVDSNNNIHGNWKIAKELKNL